MDETNDIITVFDVKKSRGLFYDKMMNPSQEMELYKHKGRTEIAKFIKEN